MDRLFLRRAASILIVVSLMLSSLTGLLLLSDNAASETVVYDQDLTVTSPRNMTNVIMSGNLVIGQGGVVTVDHGSLIFSQSAYPNEHFTLIIEDGGKLILKNATLTTQMDNIRAFPSLGVMVRNHGVLEAYDSVLRFSGHMVVDNSQLTLWRSTIEGYDAETIEQYCNSGNLFPPKVFATSPTLFFVSAEVGLYDNSAIRDIFEPDKWTSQQEYLGKMFNHDYDFATDVNNASGSRQSVQYLLDRIPSGLDTGMTTPLRESFLNLTTDDSTYYYVGGSEVLWLDGFDTAGLVFNAADGIAPVLSVKYKTDQDFVNGGAHVFFQYRDGTPVQTTLQLQNTYDASQGKSVDRVDTVTLPVMSAQDLYGLRIGYENADSDHGVSINKIWTSVEFEAQTYKNVTLAGSTDLTVINSYIGVDFSNGINHNQLVLTDNAMAEMYGVSIDLAQKADKEADRLPAFVTVEKTITVTPWALDTVDSVYPDTSSQNIGGLQADDDIDVIVGPGENLHISGFNVSGLTGPISDLALSITYLTGATFTSSYLAWSTDGVNFVNTSVSIGAAPSFTTISGSSLPTENIGSLEAVGGLEILFTNQDATTDLAIDRLWLEVTLRPTVHIYRWANITVFDTQSLPVEGASITLDPVPMYYVSGVAQSVPPADVLRYLGVDASNLLRTNAFGNALVPLPVDTIYQTSSSPNSRTTATYGIVLSYTDDGGTYTANAAVSFVNPYPNLNPAYMRSNVNIIMPGLVLDLPDLYVGVITAVPSPAYEGNSLDITVDIINQGNTTASNVEVVINCLQNGTEFVLNYTTTLSSVASRGGTQTITFQWVGVPAGVHVISVIIDPQGYIPEVVDGKDNNRKSQPVTVLPNLADLRITSADIIFLDPAPSISYPVTTQITVHNDGRAAATDALVQVYAGGDKNSGQLVGTAYVTVGAGSSNDVTVAWKPNMVGTYPVYVYVNDDGHIVEYTYTQNVAYRSITVSLVTDPSDWIFDGTTSHANLTIPRTTVFFEVRVNITVELNGRLTLDGTMMSLSQEMPYALQITVRDNGVLVISNGAQLTSNYDIRLYIIGNAQVIIEDSTVQSKVKIQADDHSSITIDSSTMLADLVAPDTSYATITATDSTLNAWSLFGGNAMADLTNVTMPLMKASGHATMYHYRWLTAAVVDGNGKALEGADVTVTQIKGEVGPYVGTTDVKGKAVFKALSDIYYGDKDTVVLGTYLLYVSYTYNSVVYPAAQESYPVSLPSFASMPKSVQTVVNVAVPGALPDLDPPLIVSDNHPDRNETVTVSTTITNLGVVPAYNVKVMFNDTGVNFFTKVIPVIYPGIDNGVGISTTWRAWYPLDPQYHNLTVIIDPDRTIKEFSTTNNMNYTHVFVQGITDLSVKRPDVVLNPYAPVQKDQVSITATVHNDGDIDATNVKVSFYARWAAPGAPELLIADQNINLIAPGGTGKAGATWAPGMPGDYTIRIAVDDVTVLTFTQNVLDFADLVPTTILFTPASPVIVNTNVVIKATIANIGQIAANNIAVKFYTGGENGVLIGEKIMNLIDPGSSADVTMNWRANITGDLKTQNVDITVVVNYPHLIAEMNYANNNFTQTIKVNEIRPDLFFPGDILITSSGVAVSGASQGEKLQISTEVSNSGNTPALGAKIVFYVRDSANKTTVIGTMFKDVGVGDAVNVLINWTINVGKGDYTILINANPDNLIDESNITNDQVEIPFIVDAPNLGLTINPLGADSYAPGTNIFVSGRAFNINTSDPMPGVTITVYLAQLGERKSANVTATTDQYGTFAMSVYIPDGLNGAVDVEAEAANAGKSTAASAGITVKEATENGIAWYVYLLILVCIVAVIVVFSMYLYKYGLGKMVECGECGALIPDSSRKCPKCGTEFEVGTAKCSECSAWIPSNSTSCPECGAKFLTQAIEEEEDAYLKKMRIQYEIYADGFKDEAKRVMGKKYHDNKFMEWWKKQPSYISFENWLAQEENKRKTGGVPCPSCGTLNPRGGQICHQCGSVLEQPKPEAPAEEPKPEGRKPLRRIVRRPAEKKPEQPAEEAKPEEQKPEEEKPQT